MDMKKVLKFFPFMPAEKDTGKLVLAILFYVLAVYIASPIICFVLGITIILAPVAFIVGIAGQIYMIIGIIFSVLSYMGKDLEQVLTDLFKK